jgi:hypothetical protein
VEDAVIPVYQQKSYDCFNACVASIFEIPLESTPDARFVMERDRDIWDQAWESFFKRMNLAINPMDYHKTLEIMGEAPRLCGYGIAIVKGWRGMNHAIVIKDGEQVHDPYKGDPEYPKSAWLHIECFQVLDPSRPVTTEVIR